MMTSKKKKTNRQLERDLKKGKISYRIRIEEDLEKENEIKEYNENKKI